jgi:hypothetical protein
MRLFNAPILLLPMAVSRSLSVVTEDWIGFVRRHGLCEQRPKGLLLGKATFAA